MACDGASNFDDTGTDKPGADDGSHVDEMESVRFFKNEAPPPDRCGTSADRFDRLIAKAQTKCLMVRYLPRHYTKRLDT